MRGGESSGKVTGPYGVKTHQREVKSAPRPLIEQLFPERYAAASKPSEPAREVPKISPIAPTPPLAQSYVPQERDQYIPRSEQLRRHMAEQPPDTSVLVLCNANKNLTEDDFRRVIPQGRHLEGWTLEQGDILRVIPGRDLETLLPTGDYYLLFSSPLSAFTYQGHVSRIHRVVTANTPSTLLSSPIPPPTGYILDGMDVQDAMNSFTLTSPDQRMQLRQLKPPLAPAVHLLVQQGGLEPLMVRKDRMPFEARLELEGPQLQLPFIRHVLRTCARDLGLRWSGGEDDLPKLARWEPDEANYMPSMSNKTTSASDWAGNLYKRGFSTKQADPSTGADHGKGDSADDAELKRRMPRPVYIVGFATERALHSFVHFWHRRPVAWPGAGKAGGEEEGDVPPVMHAQALW